MADVFTDTRTQAAQTTTASVPGVEYVRAYRFAEHGGGAVTDVFDCGNGGVFFSLAEGLSSGPETVVDAATIKRAIRAYALPIIVPRRCCKT